ncbi:MAG: hypothetical protein IKB72_06005 [Ruminococcus sp.]|nr:hypothetical protein [Ruminococcus sp.]
MKKLTIICFCLLIPIIIIPLTSVINLNKTHKTEEATHISTNDEVDVYELSEEEADYIACNAMMYINENNHNGTKEALIAICRNNFLFEEENNISHKEIKIANYSDTLLKELKETLKKEINIFLDKNRVYIPIEEISAGFIATSDEYPYISPVASPWDVFNEKYSKEVSQNCGISVAGINYLCEKGYDSLEALKWYLPNFTIKS